MSKEELFRWALSGSMLIVVKWFASWYLEDIAWWNEKLSSKTRQILILVLSLLLGSGVLLLTFLPADIFYYVEPFLVLVVSTVGIWVTGQTVHKLDKVYRSVVNAQEKKN